MDLQEAAGTPEKYIQHLCGYIVCLSWQVGRGNERGEFTQKPMHDCATGFLVEVLDRVYLVTAGHVLAGAEENKSKHGMLYKNSGILDSWGPNAPKENILIPFDLFDEPDCFSVFDETYGLDFCAIALDTLTASALGQTTKFFDQSTWIHQPEFHEFDFFHLIGFPRQLSMTGDPSEDLPGSVSVGYRPFCTRVSLTEYTREEGENAFEEFFGQLALDTKQVTDITGMSGGPILGLKRNDSGDFTIWPVAIQSRWIKEKQIVIGCPVQLFVALMIDAAKQSRSAK